MRCRRFILLLPVSLSFMLMLWPSFGAEKPRSLYDGASVMFAQAQFFKPRENARLAEPHALAPLIIQELPAAAHPQVENNFPRHVYFQPGSVELNGVVHAQMTYWWHHRPPGPGRTSAPVFKGGAQGLLPNPSLPLPAPNEVHSGNAPPKTQAIRLTMNTNGVPVIYEVLESHRRVQQIFVTQSIEAAARMAFGPALPGRRHSVERSLADAPDIVMSRVLDDPPDIMGPILYLNAESRAVATLICRCMDAQARELVGQGLYELVPGNISGKVSRATRLDAANPRGLPEDWNNPTNRLSRSLRLPPGF